MSVSDTLCRDRRLPARLPAWLNAYRQIHLHRRLVKDVGFTGPGRLPSATTPLPPRFLSRDPLARGLLPRGFRGAASRLLQSKTIREHDLEPTEPRRTRQPGDAFPCGTAPAEVFRIRGPLRGFRRTGRRRRARPKPGTVDGETPTRVDSDTFCRKSVSCTLERRAPRPAHLGAPFTNLPGAPGAYPLSQVLSRSPNELAFAKPAARLPACAGRLAVRAASRSPPRRGARSAAPKVPSIARMLAGLAGTLLVLPRCYRRMAPGR